MATRSQRYTHMLSSHPYHSAISSAPPFALGAGDGDGDHCAAGAVAVSSAAKDDGIRVGALASAPDSFFLSPARTARSSTRPARARAALPGAVPVETYSSDPKGQFLDSMAEMAAAWGTKGMTKAKYWEFMDDLLRCYLERNDLAVHEYVLAAFADLTEADLVARRLPKKRRRLRRLMKLGACVSPFQAHDGSLQKR
ncbi:hypothetical protein ACP70R_030597 [Stipagrostis hirtigluma subsp. patula]